MQELTQPHSAVLRRRDLFPYVLGLALTIIIPLGMLAAGPVTVPVAVSGAALVIGALVLCYVDGPAAYVRVTGHAVVVANVFSVHRIPRTSIDRVGGYENLGVYLFLNDGKKVSVTAFQPSISPGNRSHRQYVRRGRQLERALESIPAAVEQPSYRRRLRYSNILLMLGAIALLAVTYFWALPQINEL